VVFVAVLAVEDEVDALPVAFLGRLTDGVLRSLLPEERHCRLAAHPATRVARGHRQPAHSDRTDAPPPQLSAFTHSPSGSPPQPGWLRREKNHEADHEDETNLKPGTKALTHSFTHSKEHD